MGRSVMVFPRLGNRHHNETRGTPLKAPGISKQKRISSPDVCSVRTPTVWTLRDADLADFRVEGCSFPTLLHTGSEGEQVVEF